MSRQSRTRRRRGVKVQLTERDEAVLLALGRFRLARSSHLVDYAFSGVRRDTAMTRLRRLFDSKHLAVLPAGPMAENLYRLGPAGHQLVAELGGVSGPVPRGGVQHHLAVVQSWVSLAREDGVTLARCLPDWELRSEFKVGELAVVPDLFALLQVGEAIIPFGIEVDCGTESPKVLQAKVERYASLWGRSPGLFGYERFGLAVVLHGPRRRAAVAAALKKVWVVPHVVVAAEQTLSSALLSLLPHLQDPLGGSPYGKGYSEGVDGQDGESGK